MAKVGIIAAMDEELTLLLKYANWKGRTDEFVQCTLNGTECVLVKCGIGKVNAALTAQKLISEYNVTHVINTGIAGALEKSLNVLDLVVSSDAVHHDFDVTGFGYKPTIIPRMKESHFKADRAMVELAKSTFASLSDKEEFKGRKIVEGRVASGDQFICDRAKKDHIIELCNAACVEMEGAAIAHTCFVNSTPYVIIRCMSDKADENSLETEVFNEKKGGLISAELVYNMLGGF